MYIGVSFIRSLPLLAPGPGTFVVPKLTCAEHSYVTPPSERYFLGKLLLPNPPASPAKLRENL